MGMKMVWGLAVVVVVVVAAMMLYRSTEPVGEVEVESTLEDVSASGSGQLIQVQPDTLPPGGADEVTDAEAPAGAVVDDATVEELPATGETVTISVTDTGFVPAEVTITSGTTVVFVNDGQASHWPASDVHPTHQILPAFDSKRGLATGETYSFTFTEVGTWTMHDHLQPRFEGRIVVE